MQSQYAKQKVGLRTLKHGGEDSIWRDYSLILEILFTAYCELPMMHVKR